MNSLPIVREIREYHVRNVTIRAERGEKGSVTIDADRFRLHDPETLDSFLSELAQAIDHASEYAFPQPGINMDGGDLDERIGF
jgi:hypothetical protein